MNYDAGKCDVAVIGAGHAGIEAALACARMGLDTMIFTINLDTCGNMPCNPAIGGTGKGHLVRELDALGGEMAIAADKACIQYRMLNLGKGPAVHSLRAQADRRKYQGVMKHTLETQAGLRVKQAEIVEIGTEDGRVSFVRTHTGATYACKAAVICTGTYLKGRVIIGDVLISSGPDGGRGRRAAGCLSGGAGAEHSALQNGNAPAHQPPDGGFFKDGASAGRRNYCSILLSHTTQALENRAVCYLTYTNARTHDVIRANLHRSPLYSGVIEGVGPRLLSLDRG